MEYKRISIIGAGAMGSAIVKACANDSSLSITAINRTKEKLEVLEKILSGKVAVSTSYESLGDAEVVVLAVKPQSFPETVEIIKDKINTNALVISVMVGVRIETIQELLRVGKVVRSMPNLGTENKESMTIWTGKNINDKDILFIQNFFSLFGHQLYVENEDFVDKATAVTGSGPGFFAYVVEAYAKEVERMGFSHDDALSLTLATLNATNTILQNKKESPEEFRSRVTSKKGTTEAGLKVLMGRGLSKLFRKTLNKAYKKAKEFSKK